MQEKDKGIKFPVQGAMKLHTFNKKAVGVVFVCFFFKQTYSQKLGIGNFQCLLYVQMFMLYLYICIVF